MLQTILVYSGLTAFMYHCSRKYRRYGSWSIIFIACVTYAVIFGCRYGVGNDYFGYLAFYNDLLKFPELIQFENFEIGFRYLSKIIAYFECHYTVFFGITSFIPIYIIFLTFKNERSIYPFLIIAFMFGCQWLYVEDAIRQSIAVSLWIISIKFIAEKNYKLHYLFLIIALYFHKSSAFLFPFYLLLNWKSEWFKSLKFQYIVLFVAIILMYVNLTQYILSPIEAIARYSGYGFFVDNGLNSEFLRDDVNIGLGVFLSILINSIIIFYSNRIKSDSNNAYYKYAYNLYYLGVCCHYAFINSHLIIRFTEYFYILGFIMGAYTLRYLFYYRRFYYYVLLFLYLLTFIAILLKMDTNTTRFIFFWQDDLFYLKNYFSFN